MQVESTRAHLQLPHARKRLAQLARIVGDVILISIETAARALSMDRAHVSDYFSAYLKRADRDDAQTLDYADRLRNGAVFKRLGFLSGLDSNGEALDFV